MMLKHFNGVIILTLSAHLAAAASAATVIVIVPLTSMYESA